MLLYFKERLLFMLDNKANEQAYTYIPVELNNRGFVPALTRYRK